MPDLTRIPSTRSASRRNLPATLICALAGGVAHSPPAFAEDGTEESIVYELRVYNNSECDGTLGNPANLIYADNMATKWQDAVDAWGSFERNDVVSNSTPEAEDIQDASKDEMIGNDYNTTEGVDSYDIGYLISHSTYSCSAGAETTSWGFPATSYSVTSDHCFASTRTEMLLGNTDANLFYTAGCNTVQRCVWQNGGYTPLDSSDFKLYAGFHGINTDGPAIPGNVDDFVSGSRWSGAGSNWLAEMNITRAGSNNDDCAVVHIWAEDSTLASNFYSNAGLQDWGISVGSHSIYAVFYVDGCDPEDGETLP